MPTGPVTADAIKAFINTVYEDAMYVARDNNLMLPLVTFFGDRSGTAARASSIYGTAIMQSVGETDDLASQTFAPTSLATLTPAEIGGQFFVTDTRIETDFNQVRSDAAQELGLALAQKIEIDLLGDFSSLTGGTIGAASTVITWGHVLAGLSVLRGQLAPLPYTLVLHPYQWHVLGKAVAPGATVTNAPMFQDSVMRNFYVGSVSGINIFTSANIGGAGTNTARGAIFARPAIAFDSRRAPRLEPERDASRRGWELNQTGLYAHGVWRPKFGVQMVFDCAVPTS